MKKIKHSTEKTITLRIWDKNVVVEIIYTKNSRLKTRLKVLEELKKELYK